MNFRHSWGWFYILVKIGKSFSTFWLQSTICQKLGKIFKWMWFLHLYAKCTWYVLRPSSIKLMQVKYFPKDMTGRTYVHCTYRETPLNHFSVLLNKRTESSLGHRLENCWDQHNPMDHVVPNKKYCWSFQFLLPNRKSLGGRAIYPIRIQF